MPPQEEISTLEKAMDSLNIAVASQGFIINFFNIYSAMKKSERPKALWSVLGGLGFTMTVYCILSVLSIFYFGISNIQPSILDNLKTEKSVAITFLYVIFLAIFFCNIPFVFFAGKKSLFGIIEICSKKKHVEENSPVPQ